MRPMRLGYSLGFACLTAVGSSSASASDRAALHEPEWQEIATGGNTICARGTPYSFFVMAGDPNKIVVDFIGGGACWDAETCAPETATFVDSVDDMRDNRGSLDGIYRRDRSDNPYNGWTHIAVPYCTGDVHWGDAVVNYTKEDGESFTIHHKGAVNTRAVLEWISAHYQTPKEILVSGCSAGAYGSIYWAPYLNRQYPAARLVHFGDSGAGILTPEFMSSGFPLWNVVANAPDWIPGLNPAEADFNKLALSDVYRAVAGYLPEARFAQFNHFDDAVQQAFYWRMGGDPLTWTTRLLGEQDQLTASLSNYRTFIAPGSDHCVTTGEQFYETISDGVQLKNWLSDYIGGHDPQSVACAECELK